MNQPAEIDDDVAAMRKANRAPLVKGLAIAGGALLAASLWMLSGKASVRGSLEEEGYTNVDVKMNTPVEYGFTAKRGNRTCGGTITRLPFSTSRSVGCF